MALSSPGGGMLATIFLTFIQHHQHPILVAELHWSICIHKRAHALRTVI